jgi:D-glycero-D-manno-heptose 1,7-bisphosphate phosphatase
MRRAVFLDRDGVLNRAIVRAGRPYSPATPAELEILPGVPEACDALKQAGFALVVVTNQPDVARGTQSRGQVEAANALIIRRVPLDDVRVCYHDDGDGCSCRKPRPGLLLEAARDLGIDLARSFMVGDRWNDVEAGRRAGCRTVLIEHGYLEPAPESPEHRAASLREAADWILAQP